MALSIVTSSKMHRFSWNVVALCFSFIIDSECLRVSCTLELRDPKSKHTRQRRSKGIYAFLPNPHHCTWRILSSNNCRADSPPVLHGCNDDMITIGQSDRGGLVWFVRTDLGKRFTWMHRPPFGACGSEEDCFRDGRWLHRLIHAWSRAYHDGGRDGWLS